MFVLSINLGLPQFNVNRALKAYQPLSFSSHLEHKRHCIYCGEKLTINDDKYRAVVAKFKSVNTHAGLMQLVENVHKGAFFPIPQELSSSFTEILMRMRTSQHSTERVKKQEFYRNQRKAISHLREQCEKRIFTRDHLQPRSRSGPTNPNNLAPCCRACNNQRGNQPLIEFLFNGTRPRLQLLQNEERVVLRSNRSVPRERWEQALIRLAEFVVEPLFAEPKVATKTRLFRRKNIPSVRDPEHFFSRVPSRLISMAERLRNILKEAPLSIRAALVDECLTHAGRIITERKENGRHPPRRWRRRLARLRIPNDLIEIKQFLVRKLRRMTA